MTDWKLKSDLNLPWRIVDQGSEGCIIVDRDGETVMGSMLRGPAMLIKALADRIAERSTVKQP